MADIFISYAVEDKPFAKKLADGLIKAGFSVWWDRDIKSGDIFNQVIRKELDAARVAIVIWSPNSIDSNWVQSEADRASKQNKLRPISIGRVEPPMPFTVVHTENFSKWQGSAEAQEFVSLRESLGFQPGSTPLPPLRPPRLRRWLLVLLMLMVLLLSGYSSIYFPTCMGVYSNVQAPFAKCFFGVFHKSFREIMWGEASRRQ